MNVISSLLDIAQNRGRGWFSPPGYIFPGYVVALALLVGLWILWARSVLSVGKCPRVGNVGGLRHA